MRPFYAYTLLLSAIGVICLALYIAMPPKKSSSLGLGDRLDPVKSSTIGTYTSKPPIVNLPHGERFLYVIPKNDAAAMGFRPYNHYVTEKIAKNDSTRIISVWGPGGSPGSWQLALEVKEN